MSFLRTHQTMSKYFCFLLMFYRFSSYLQPVIHILFILSQKKNRIHSLKSSCPSNICWVLFSPTELPGSFCWKSIKHKCKGLFGNSQLWAIDSCLSLYYYNIWVTTALLIRSTIRKHKSLNSVRVFPSCVASPDPLNFHINLSDSPYQFLEIILRSW